MHIPLRPVRKVFLPYYGRRGDVQAVKVEIFSDRKVGISLFQQTSHRDNHPKTKSTQLRPHLVRKGFKATGLLLDKEAAENLWLALDKAFSPEGGVS